MLRELPRWIRPDIVCTEARNSGFVVYTSSTMEPSTSFTVNWKSNPLTNSWTTRGEGDEKAVGHETTILPRRWYRLVDFLSNVATNPLPLDGEEIPQFLHGVAKANIQESTVSLSLFLDDTSVSTKIRSRGRKTKGERSKGMWNMVFVTVLLTIRDNGRGKCLFSRVTSVREQVKTGEKEQDLTFLLTFW